MLECVFIWAIIIIKNSSILDGEGRIGKDERFRGYKGVGVRQLRTSPIGQKEIGPKILRFEVNVFSQRQTEIKRFCAQRDPTFGLHFHALCHFIQILLLHCWEPNPMHHYGVCRWRGPRASDQPKDRTVQWEGIRGEIHMENCISSPERAQRTPRAQYYSQRPKMCKYFLCAGNRQNRRPQHLQDHRQWLCFHTDRNAVLYKSLDLERTEVRQ